MQGPATLSGSAEINTLASDELEYEAKFGHFKKQKKNLATLIRSVGELDQWISTTDVWLAANPAHPDQAERKAQRDQFFSKQPDYKNDIPKFEAELKQLDSALRGLERNITTLRLKLNLPRYTIPVAISHQLTK